MDEWLPRSRDDGKGRTELYRRVSWPILCWRRTFTAEGSWLPDGIGLSDGIWPMAADEARGQGNISRQKSSTVNSFSISCNYSSSSSMTRCTAPAPVGPEDGSHECCVSATCVLRPNQQTVKPHILELSQHAPSLGLDDVVVDI